MAEKIFNNIAKKQKLKIKAESAGIYANVGEDISAGAIKSLKKLRIRNVKHKSQQFFLDNLYNYDYCVAVTQEIKNYIGKFNNVFCFQDFVSGATDIVDPFGQNQEVYDLTLKQIRDYVEILITKIGE